MDHNFSDSSSLIWDIQDKETRIKIRREKINALLDKKNNFHTNGDKSQYNPHESQIAKSVKTLNVLSNENWEFITNIKTASDAFDSLRYNEKSVADDKRVEKLNRINEEISSLYEEINNMVGSLDSLESASALQILLDEQFKKCEALSKSQKKMIEIVKNDINKADENYMGSLDTKSREINTICERIESQIKVLHKSCSKEISSIEHNYEIEREKIFKNQDSEWQSLIISTEKKEKSFIESRISNAEKFELQMNTIRMKFNDNLTVIRNKYESLIHDLELKLQKLKTTFQLNIEKLEYNFILLKRRDEENMMIKSEQKRKLTKMQDTINALKNEEVVKKIELKNQNEFLLNDLKYRYEMQKNLENRSKEIVRRDNMIFVDILKLNKQECCKLSKELFESDKDITEKILGFQWTKPKLNLEETKEVPPSIVMIERERGEGSRNSNVQSSVHKKLSAYDAEKMKTIIDEIIDEGKFLVDSVVLHQLKDTDEKDYRLIVLDMILSIIGIKKLKDLEYLLKIYDGKNNKGLLVKYAEEKLEDNCNKDLRRSTVIKDDNAVFFQEITRIIDEKSDMWKTLSQLIDEYSKKLVSRERTNKEIMNLRQENKEIADMIKLFRDREIWTQ